MSQMTVIKNDAATLWYYPDKKIVHHKIHKFLYGEKFREILSGGAELIEKYGANKYLSEDTDNTVVTKEDAEWGTAVWTPRVIKAGWKYWAIVQPKKVIAQANMKEFAKMYAGMGVTVQMFSDTDSAMKWLETQN